LCCEASQRQLDGISGLNFNLLIKTLPLDAAISPLKHETIKAKGGGGMRMSEREDLILPRIDHAALPDLDMLTGAFGSFADSSRIDAEDDNHAELMLYLLPFAVSD